MTGGIIKAILPWPLRLLMGAKEALGTLLGIIRTHPREAAIVALLLALAWTWHGKSKAIEQRDAWHLAFDKQKAAYIAAQREAEANAIAAKLAQEAKDEQRRKKADEHLKQDMADDRRLADAYASRMRCQAPRSAPRSADLPSAAEAPKVATRPGDTTELVGITRTDLEICTVNSRRLINAHDWALPDMPDGGK